MADEVKSVEENVVTLTTEEQPKRGRKKSTATPAKKSTTPKKTVTKKAEVKTTVKAKKATAPEINFKSFTFEFNDKKYTEKDLFDKVKAYISSHPYIVAHDVEIFAKPADGCAYFTIDGFSNSDFRIEL